MPDADLQAAIDRLYGAPLEAFVEERKRLAQALRAAGDRAAAAEVARLPKPTAAAWALNRVAREAPDVTEGWLQAAAELRRATAEVGRLGGDPVRAAASAHRALTARLLTVVRELAQPSGRPLSDPLLDRVRALLHAATADPALAERLRAGRIAEERTGAGALAKPSPAAGGAEHAAAAAGDPKAGAEAPATADDAASAAPRDAAAAEARARRRADLERRAGAALAEVERRRAERERRAEAAAAAEGRLEDALRTLHRTRSEAGAARQAVADADDALATAEGELERLRSLLGEDDG